MFVLGAADEFVCMQHVELKEMEGAAMVLRVEGELVHEVELGLVGVLFPNFLAYFAGEESVFSVEDCASEDHAALINCYNIAHLKYNNYLNQQ
jgi:hypothetical protein